MSIVDRCVMVWPRAQIESLEMRKQAGEELDPDQEKKILRGQEVIIELEKTQAKLSRCNWTFSHPQSAMQQSFFFASTFFVNQHPLATVVSPDDLGFPYCLTLHVILLLHFALLQRWLCIHYKYAHMNITSGKWFFNCKSMWDTKLILKIPYIT